MYNNVSEQFATTIRSPSRTFNLRLKINGKWIDAGFKKMGYETASTSDEGIQIGSAVAAKIELTVKRINELFENTEIPIEIGLKLPSGKYEYIPLGFFTAEHPTLDQTTTTFTAYDRMMKTTGVYVSELTYPASAESVLKEISTGCGVPCNVSGLNGITIDTAPVGYTYREVIGYIASLAGGFACVDRTGTIVIKWYEDNGYTINESRIMTFEKNESDYHLDYLTCNVDSNTSFTVGSGTLGITFDNPLTTEEKLNSVYKKVRGFAYRGASLKTLGDIRLDPWDIVTVEELGKTYKVPVMNITQEYDGGLAMTITAYGKTETETETDYKGPSTKLTERTYAEMMLTKELVSKKVDAEWVKANTVQAETVVAINNELENIRNNYLKSNIAEIKYATIESLKGVSGEFEKFKTNDFTAVTGKVNDLTVGVEKVNTLMFGSASGGSLTTEFSNAIVSLIGDAQIKSAMIESIDAKKITALDINTTSMKVHSESGLSYWQDNTIVISDGTRTRVQLGKDASADYNMYIWDKAGNLMFDALGLTAKGIQREIIRNDMVSQDAGISAGKLDIGSLFEVINKDESHTLKSSKIYVDADNQTLDVSFKTITTKTNTAVEAANKATESADNALSTANSADAKAQSVVNRADSGEFKGDKGDQGIQGPKGDTGATGATGATGNGIKSIAEHYAVSASNASAPTSWSNTVPTMTVTNRYLWNYETITYTNNSVVDTAKRVIGVYGNTGETGIGVKQITPQYYLSTSNATQNGGSWSNTRPAWISGRYYWTRDYILWTDGSATYSTPQLATDMNNLYSSLKTVTDTVSYQGTQLSTVQGQISSKVWQQDITTAVTSLEIGGRNLAQNTNQGTSGWSWNMQTGGYTATEVTESGVKTCKLTRNNVAQSGWSVISYNNIGRSKLETNTTYTISFDVRGNVDVNSWGVQLLRANGTGQLCATWSYKNNTSKANVWSKIICTIKTVATFPESTDQQLYLNAMPSTPGTWYKFKNLKIEKGDKATDWSPAPEDVDSSITSVEGKVTTISNKYTDLNQALSSLTATVNSNTTAISKKADGSIVTSLQSNITALQADLNSIKSEISKTYVTNNALSDSLSGIDESIGKLQEDQMYYTKTEQLDNYIKQLITDDTTETSIVLSGEYATKTYVDKVGTDAIATAGSNTGKILESYSTTAKIISEINPGSTSIKAAVTAKLGKYATSASLSAYIAKSDTGTLKSCIEAIADDINLTAGGTINISGNKSVNISGNKFSLDSSGTKISSAGYLQTTNAKLGEWNVDSKAIYCETADKVYTAYLQNPDYVVGNTREDAWVYSVQKNGIATFYVTSEGDLYCRSFSTPYTTYQPNYRWATYENNLNTTLFIRTFHGPCLIIANVSIWTDDTSDYGTIKCGLYLDGYCVTENQHRLETTNAIELSAGATYVWYFSDNEAHTLSGIGGSTKNGKKTITYSVQALFNNDVGWGTGQ